MAAVAIGSLGMLGWVADVPMLTRYSPDWVTMKFPTAMGLVVAGGMASVDVAPGRAHARVCAALAALLIGLVVVTLPASTGALLAMGDDGHRSVRPGMPSLGTLFGFVILAASGLAHGLGLRLRCIRVHYALAELIGWAALAGYVFGSPALTYEIPDVSTAMAMPTALGFVLLGRARMAAPR